jgi:MFS family permease
MPASNVLASPRAANMLVFAAFGAVVGTFSGSIPVILRQTGISSELFGLTLTAMTVAAVIMMALGGPISRRFSYRMILLATLPLIGMALTLVMTTHSAALLIMLLIIKGGLIGLTDCIMNAEGSVIEHDLARPVFTVFHGGLSVAVAVSAILSSLLTDSLGPLASCAVALAVIAFAVWGVWSHTPFRALPEKPAKGAAGIMTMPLVLMGLAVGLVNAAEMSAVFWSAKMLHGMAPELAAIAGLGVAFFGLCNAAIRMPGDGLRARFGDTRLMLASLAAAVLGFLALWLSPGFVFSVFAFALVGLGLAIVCPCIFNMAARDTPANRAGALGYVGLVAGGPRILAPYTFGWISGGYSINAAFGVCAIVTFAALMLVLALARQPSARARAAQGA